MTENKNAFGYIQELPEEIKQPYQYICQELAYVSDKWKLYKDLFIQKDNIDVINSTAPRAFQAFEESLRIDIAMSISRLADPINTIGKKNLSVEMLLEKMTNIKQLEAAISKFKALSKPIIRLRNKQYAHNDLNCKLHPKSNPFPRIGQNTIDSIIKSLSDILNLIIGHYKDEEMGFEPLSIGSGKDLVFWLKEGMNSYKEKQTSLLKII